MLGFKGVSSPLVYLVLAKIKQSTKISHGGSNSWLSAELQMLLGAKAFVLFMFKGCFLAEQENRRLGCCYFTRFR